MERVSKQLILSSQRGGLKPEVRLGVAVSEFAQTLDDDRKRQFQKMQTAGTQLSGRDAIRVTEELNRQLATAKAGIAPGDRMVLNVGNSWIDFRHLQL